MLQLKILQYTNNRKLELMQTKRHVLKTKETVNI